MDTTQATAAARFGTRKAGPQIRVREADFSDHAQITALQVRNGLVPLAHDDWTALWKSNPVYRTLPNPWPIGWVLESEDREIVGSIGNVPLAYQFRGRELIATSPCSWVVDDRYRSHSLRILERVTRQKNIDLIVCTSVGPSSEPVWRVLESKAPVGAWNQSEFWITNYLGFTESALRKKSIPAAGALKYPAALALLCRDAIASRAPCESGRGDIEICSEFDERFDEFWRDSVREKHNMLLAVRTRETLEWHFGSSLRRGNAWLWRVCRGRHMAAYAVFDRQDRPDLGLRRVRIVDFQALNGYEELLPVFVCRMLQKCRQGGFHVLENVGCWLQRPDLPCTGAPHRRSLPSWMYYYKAIDRDLVEALKNPAVWAPSAYDGDASL